jgi:hypothetical protein
MMLILWRNPLQFKRPLFIIMMTIDTNTMSVDRKHAAIQIDRTPLQRVPMSWVNP